MVSLEMATFSQDHPTDWSCLWCRGGPHVDAPSRMVAGLGGPFDGWLEGGGVALTFCFGSALRLRFIKVNFNENRVSIIRRKS